MASFSSPTIFSLIQLITVFLTFSISHSLLDCYTSIISFGDSLADTGNKIRQSNYAYHANRLPYGETYFHHPTGRLSDGRLIVDFIAEELGLPYVPPYLGGSSIGDFRQGVNFAFAGSTALDAAFFQERGIPNENTNNSLGIQLGWFEDLLPSLCSNPPDCEDIFRRSLFLVGEIGGNDYNHPFLQRRSMEEIRTFVPLVINAIGSSVDMLIKYGARTLVVPGNLPIGCSAAYLTVFESPRKEDYDPLTGCLTYLNEFAEYHNRLLLKELDRLRALYPNATIIYADYYNAALRFYRSPRDFGALALLQIIYAWEICYVGSHILAAPIMWDPLMVIQLLVSRLFSMEHMLTICPSLGGHLSCLGWTTVQSKPSLFSKWARNSGPKLMHNPNALSPPDPINGNRVLNDPS